MSVRNVLVAAFLSGVAFAGAALAQPEWAPMGPPPPYRSDPYLGADPREGKIQTAQFVANSPTVRALGHGSIKVSAAPGSMTVGSEDFTYQAAVIDQLGRAGYTTDASSDGQVAELSVRHSLVQPPEPPRSPVAGEVGVGGGNRGSGVGVAIALDFSKPRTALIATRIDARIRDHATNEVLWEGHAEVMTRDGDKHWTTQVLATRLATALFKGFPRAS
jgi:hypothetical protein